MNRKLVAAGLALALGAGVALSASAQVKPEILVKQRQAVMTLQAKYFGPLAGMAQGRVPYNAQVVARNAAYLEVLSKMPWDGFAASTEGTKSHALPAIWKDAAKFKAAQEHLESEIGKLAEATKGGNEATIKAAIGAVSKACSGCHEHFREKE